MRVYNGFVEFSGSSAEQSPTPAPELRASAYVRHESTTIELIRNGTPEEIKLSAMANSRAANFHLDGQFNVQLAAALEHLDGRLNDGVGDEEELQEEEEGAVGEEEEGFVGEEVAESVVPPPAITPRDTQEIRRFTTDIKPLLTRG
jgi:hypothetical protein